MMDRIRDILNVSPPLELVELPDGRSVLSMLQSSATIEFKTVYVAASDSSDADKAAAGYVCDGTADEVTIKDAITSLLPLGGVVHLYTGKYTFGDTLIWNSNDTFIPYLEITGDATTNPDIEPDSATILNAFWFDPRFVGNLGLSRLDIVANGSAQNFDNGIKVDHYSGTPNYMDCLCQVYFYDVDMDVSGGIYGILIEHVFSANVALCTFTGSGTYGLHINGVGTGGVALSCCTANDDWIRGFYIRAVYGNVVLTECSADGNSLYGAYIATSESVYIKDGSYGSPLNGNAAGGIYIDTVGILMVDGADCEDNGGHGLNTIATDFATISGTFKDNSASGVNMTVGVAIFTGGDFTGNVDPISGTGLMIANGLTVTGYDPVFPIALPNIIWIINCTKDVGAAWGVLGAGTIYYYTQSVVTDVDFVTPAQTKKTLGIVGVPPP